MHKWKLAVRSGETLVEHLAILNCLEAEKFEVFKDLPVSSHALGVPWTVGHASEHAVLHFMLKYPGDVQIIMALND